MNFRRLLKGEVKLILGFEEWEKVLRRVLGWSRVRREWEPVVGGRCEIGKKHGIGMVHSKTDSQELARQLRNLIRRGPKGSSQKEQ